jgi:hypothetical protein
MKKKILYITILLVIFYILYFLVGTITKRPVTLLKCPDDYGTDDAGSTAYLADFDSWTNSFYDQNNGATLTDWSKARYDYWVDNNCQAAIARYNEAKMMENS